MATEDEAWRVLRHGPIEQLAENLWRVVGALPGMSLERQMTVAKRTDGKVVIHSAIAMNEPAMTELESFGELAYLVVPNAFHRLDAARYKKRYPKLTVLAPIGSREKVAKLVDVGGTYDDYGQDAAVRLEALAGIKAASEGVMLVRSKDGTTVVMNDVMFNMAKKPSDVMGWLITTVFASAPGPRVTRLGKMTLVDDAALLRTELLRLSALPDLRRVIVAHGDVARGADAANALRTAATYL